MPKPKTVFLPRPDELSKWLSELFKVKELFEFKAASPNSIAKTMEESFKISVKKLHEKLLEKFISPSMVERVECRWGRRGSYNILCPFCWFCRKRRICKS